MASNDAADGQVCHACGRGMFKAKKIHDGRRYCATCYPRLFKRRMCSACGNLARLPTFDVNAPCPCCKRRKACIRCGKVEFKIGKCLPEGPVCRPCVVYFREPEPCEECGKLTQRLARNTRTGRRTCPKCSSSPAATCPSCRRYRVLVIGPDGIQRCRVCTEEGKRSCETCGIAMPAGRGRECERCYWKKTFEKRLTINLHGFSSREFEELFKRFGLWLFENTGPRKSALKINVYYSFFHAIEAKWSTLPTYEELLEHFSAAGLRRAETPMRWLSENQAIVVGAEIREWYSEKRRLQNILDEIGEPWPRRLLEKYLITLSSKVKENEAELRSARLSLRAAANLLSVACLETNALPTQKTIEAYWRSSPGQVSALTGFIGYLNKTYHLQLKWKPEGRWLEKARIDKAERELVTLLRTGRQGKNFEKKWIVKGLAYFHGVRRARQKTLIYRSASYNGFEGFYVEYDGIHLWVPSAGSYNQKGHQRFDFSQD